jgi:hypothetical protein
MVGASSSLISVALPLILVTLVRRTEDSGHRKIGNKKGP